MISFTTDIEIKQPLDDVFDFVSKGENNSSWNSAVTQVEQLGECEHPVGCRYKMYRSLPDGPVENIYEVIEFEQNRVLKIKIIEGPTPFTYTYFFERDGDLTRIVLTCNIEEDGLPIKLPSFLASLAIKRGVNSNLTVLKELLESAS